MQILPASEVPLSEIREGMVAAFSDYAAPMAMDDVQFAFMMRQREVDLAASRVAVEASQVVAIWLVSVAGTDAYLISAGTRIAARGRGLARRLADASNGTLGQRGVRFLCTEVMEENDSACRLYERLGMVPVRLLDCYALPDAVQASSVAVEEAGWLEIADAVAPCRDWAPTWQNTDAALSRVVDDTRVFVVRDAAGLAGYAAVIDRMAVLAQVAVRADRRRQGIGRALVARACATATRALRVLNADRADWGFAAFMAQVQARWIVGHRALLGAI